MVNNKKEAFGQLVLLSSIHYCTSTCSLSTAGATTGTLAVRPTRSSRTSVGLLNIPTPTIDRDRTVLRRSEPSSRATLMGEQPNPWDLLQPQDVTSRHRGAKPPRRYELLGRSACYPRSTFYPLSDVPSMWNHRITLAVFRPWSTCQSLSQAPFCYYALRTVTNGTEGTFASLRYSFGGDHPSQTTRHTLSLFPGIRT